ncbi:MAG: undecaprenyl-phosphate glucose phosphotransferase [Pseudomonadales bacterium]|nr:undecaprenyl-phosphate glucose phosphotransferase [Pseudomonadales bacterium]
MVQQGYIHRNQRLISAVQRLLDLLVISSCLFISNILYHDAIWAVPAPYLITGLLASCFFYVVGSSNGLYQSWRFEELASELKLILNTWIVTVIGLLAVGWAVKISSDLSRVVIGSWFLIAPVILLFTRFIVRQVLKHLRKKGLNTRTIAVVGGGDLAQSFVQEVAEHSWMGYQVKGFYADQHEIDNGAMAGLQHLGDYQQLLIDVRAQRLDEVFIALPMVEEDTIRELIINLSDSSTPVHVVPDLFISKLMNARLATIGDMATISVFNSPHDDFAALMKRLEDIIITLPILLLISPLMLLIAVAIKLTSPGPVFFKQRRYGIGAEAIDVWKFRSMTVCENDELAITQAQKGDVRITPLGAFLRRSSLDELPQFINVLQGRMSIVGPRPHAVAHNELYRKDIEGYMLRHLVKPGITGWAQINGWRGETDTLEKMEKRVEFDMFYIRHWSIWFDIKIIVQTIFKGFFNKNAY